MSGVQLTTRPSSLVAQVTVDQPLRKRAGEDELAQDGKPCEVWVQRLCFSAAPNRDAQLLLRNMEAHQLALKLVQLPVAKEPRAQELRSRAVIRAAYRPLRSPPLPHCTPGSWHDGDGTCVAVAGRLLRAMTTGFPLVQSELVAHVPVFLAHIDFKLAAYDISPTELISAVYEGNRATCAQASAAAIGLLRTCSRRKPV